MSVRRPVMVSLVLIASLVLGLTSTAMATPQVTQPTLTTFGDAVTDSKGGVVLTGNQMSQRGSAWTDQATGITDFTAAFTYEVSGGETDLGDGFAFVIQSESGSLLGGAGGDFGFYDGGDAPSGNSLAVIFNSYNCGPCAPDTYIGVADNADRGDQEELLSGTAAMAKIQGKHRAEISRIGSVLTVKVDRQVVGSVTLTKTYANAWVGFTGATGGATQRTRIHSFKFERPGIVDVTAGARHTCALLESGSVYCWGGNGNGQLGDGSNTVRLTPVPVSGLSGVTQISAGGFHTCARTRLGLAYCWGANGYGQLGTGDNSNRSTPVQVEGDLDEVISVATGSVHSCAITQGGGVQCWGENTSGQLGDGTTDSSNLPVAVVNLPAVAKLVGDFYQTCAQTSRRGSVLCWGDNRYGQLGDGTLENSSVPIQVPGVTARDLAVAAYHVCVLQRGAVQCWGGSPYGQLGNGATETSLTPVFVSGMSRSLRVSALTAMGGHTCAIRTDGTVACWGLNVAGGLGDGTLDNRSVPTTAIGVTGASDIDAGYYHTCAITDGGGALRCWGYNGYGQLGDGTYTDRTQAITVPALNRG